MKTCEVELRARDAFTGACELHLNDFPESFAFGEGVLPECDVAKGNGEAAAPALALPAMCGDIIVQTSDILAAPTPMDVVIASLPPLGSAETLQSMCPQTGKPNVAGAKASADQSYAAWAEEAEQPAAAEAQATETSLSAAEVTMPGTAAHPPRPSAPNAPDGVSTERPVDTDAFTMLFVMRAFDHRSIREDTLTWKLLSEVGDFE